MYNVNLSANEFTHHCIHIPEYDQWPNDQRPIPCSRRWIQRFSAIAIGIRLISSANVLALFQIVWLERIGQHHHWNDGMGRILSFRWRSSSNVEHVVVAYVWWPGLFHVCSGMNEVKVFPLHVQSDSQHQHITSIHSQFNHGISVFVLSSWIDLCTRIGHYLEMNTQVGTARLAWFCSILWFSVPTHCKLKTTQDWF